MRRLFPKAVLPKITIKAEWSGAMPAEIANSFGAGNAANNYLWKQFEESMNLMALEAERIFRKGVKEGELGHVPYISGRAFPRWFIGAGPPGVNIHLEWIVPPVSSTMKEGETSKDFIPPHKLLIAEKGLLAKSMEQKIRDEYMQWMKKERVLPKDFKFANVERELEVFMSAIRAIYTWTRLAKPKKLYISKKKKGVKRAEGEEVGFGVTEWQPSFQPGVALGEKERKALIKRWGREPFPMDPGKSMKLRRILSYAGAPPDSWGSLTPIFESVGVPKIFFERRIVKEKGEGGKGIGYAKEYFFLPTHFITRACAAYLSTDKCTALVRKALNKVIAEKATAKGTWL